jgi:ferric-dicitrate binding protein FerR (iron transport regulator)
MKAEAIAEYHHGELSSDARQDIERHLPGCLVCQRELNKWQQLSYAATHLVPHSTELRARSIEQVLRVARQSPAAQEPSRWRFTFWVPVSAMMAAAVTAFVWLQVARAPQWPVVEKGSLALGGKTLAPGAEMTLEGEVSVNAGPAAELLLPDGSRIMSEPASRFVLHEKGSRLVLNTGAVALSVTPRAQANPFSVETDEALVRVIGTRFAVSRKVAQRATRVEVEEGVVEVRSKLDQSTRRLTAGQSWVLEPPPHPPGAPAPTEPEPAALDISDEAAPAATITPELIRKRIRSGKVAAAKVLLSRAQKVANRQAAPELAIVAAEIQLAERKFDAAIASYLLVGKRYPKTPQAESALFAASGVAIDHPEVFSRDNAQVLLQRYLRLYPQGRFQAEAASLLQAIKRKE